jgi:nucleotide-binding universal stress UspA family protein
MMEYPKYRKVLFCTDFSQNSDYAFEFASGIAKRDEGLLYILHVIPTNPHSAYIENTVGEEILKQVQEQIEEDLDNNYSERYLKRVENGIRYEIVTKSGREDEKIIEFAKEKNVDIIVLGTHGRTGIEHVFFGSIAEKVLRRSHVPIFVIPCRKKLQRAKGEA